jgi:hypothetical protein
MLMALCRKSKTNVELPRTLGHATSARALHKKSATAVA